MVAVARRNSQTNVSFWLFDKNQSLRPGNVERVNFLLTDGFSVQHLVPGNFDGDRWPDFVAYRGGLEEVFIYTYNGAEYVSMASLRLNRPDGVGAVAVGDIDGAEDNLDELVVSSDGALYIYKLNNGTWGDPVEEIGIGASSIALGNVDGVVANGTSGTGVDLIVGDHRDGSGKLRNHGSVQVFGDTGFLVRPFFTWTTPITVPGNQVRNDRFGRMVAAAERLNLPGPPNHDLIAIGSQPKRAAVYPTSALTVNPLFTLTPDTDDGADNSWAARRPVT